MNVVLGKNDAGHGGIDSGAVGEDILEKNYNLLISKYMYDRFNELNIPVAITREEDITLNPSDRINKVFSFYGNDPNVILISNHLNAGGGNGAEVIYALRNDSKLANEILKNIGMVGQNTRRVYSKRLPSDFMKDYYYMLRESGDLESLIVEYGFIDNLEDLEFLKNNYKELAEAVIKAILEYKGIPYIKPYEEEENQYYVIKPGDTLYSLAKQFNTTVDELKLLNSLSTNMLKLNQKIKIPTENVDNNIYVVKKGDTLYSIASKFNVSLIELKELNYLDSDNIFPGQILIVKKV